MYMHGARVAIDDDATVASGPSKTGDDDHKQAPTKGRWEGYQTKAEACGTVHLDEGLCKQKDVRENALVVLQDTVNGTVQIGGRKIRGLLARKVKELCLGHYQWLKSM